MNCVLPLPQSSRAGMEAYAAENQWSNGTYIIPGTNSTLHSAEAPLIQESDTMGNEVVPELIVDPGVYFRAPNCYGYYNTGMEPHNEWHSQHRFLGSDGQDLHPPAFQPEGMQFVYYTPNYGYAQSPYNPYNPYIPGAITVAHDSQFMGTQQYIPNPVHHQHVSSTPYFPLILQPGLDVTSTITPDLSLVNGGGLVAPTPETSVVTYMFPPTSVDTTSSFAKEAPHPAVFHPMSKLTEGSQPLAPLVKPAAPSTKPAAPSIKPATSQGANAAAGQYVSQIQGRNSSGTLRTLENFQGTGTTGTSPSKMNVPSHYGLNGFGSTLPGWSEGGKLHSRYAFTSGLNNMQGNNDLLGEQNRGPRTSKPRNQATSSILVKAYTNKAGCVDGQGNITINTDEYNRSDFPVKYPSAKFFVIKSYSEDDVHKSIKYNVWSSTPNGNKRLTAAFDDAQRISGGNRSFCPVFLFFSVNASGQFCGVAEMIGPVDFLKDMDFWQQDKWSGSFPVKWHIVKDVPNTSFRHIILENNENKPVTNSRDTQEILYIPGLNMLSIFKDSPLGTSVLDDFIYYEERQRIMYEEKSRLLGRNNINSFLITAASPLPSKVTVTIKAPPKQDEVPSELKGYNLNDHVNVPLKEDEKQGVFNDPVNIDDHATSVTCQNAIETIDAVALNGKVDGQSFSNEGSNDLHKKIELLSIDSSDDNSSETLVNTASQSDIFTVGSMPVKVNGFGEFSTLTIGTISIDPKGI